MDTNKYKTLLISKQQELEEEIGQLRVEGRESRSAEVEDPMDYVTSSQDQAAAFEMSSKLTDTLDAVKEALQRIEAGTYGRCTDCGEEIEEARLNAVPWTPYCKADQEKHDARNAQAATAGELS